MHRKNNTPKYPMFDSLDSWNIKFIFFENGQLDPIVTEMDIQITIVPFIWMEIKTY